MRGAWTSQDGIVWWEDAPGGKEVVLVPKILFDKEGLLQWLHHHEE
jgi:hypothetical protein